MQIALKETAWMVMSPMSHIISLFNNFLKLNWDKIMQYQQKNSVSTPRYFLRIILYEDLNWDERRIIIIRICVKYVLNNNKHKKYMPMWVLKPKFNNTLNESFKSNGKFMIMCHVLCFMHSHKKNSRLIKWFYCLTLLFLLLYFFSASCILLFIRLFRDRESYNILSL